MGPRKKSLPQSGVLSKNWNVPIMDIEGMGYDVWRSQLDCWEDVTDAPMDLRALIVRLTLSPGLALNAAMHVPKDQLKSKQGMKLLLEQLDRVFIPDALQRDYAVHHQLYRMVRSPERRVCDFVNDFADQYLKFQQTNNSLPEKTLAFMLLSACNLNTDKVQLVMSGLPKVITYIEMQDQLKRIFSTEVLANNGEQLNSQGSSDILLNKNATSVREDNNILMANNEVSVSNNRQDIALIGSNKQSGYNRDNNNCRHTCSYRGRFPRRNFRRFSGRNAARQRPYIRGRNPLDGNGYPMSCNKCRSVFHFAKDCPEEKHGRDSRDHKYSRDHEVNLAWFSLSYLFVGCASSEEDRLQQLIDDSEGYAILDSGCANSVAGIDWFTKYVNNLSVKERLEISVTPSNETFTFGDGKTVPSMRKVVFPCWTAGEKATVATDIVYCKIPLLLSRKSMSQVKIKLDFGTDTAYVKGRPIKLKITRSGHYALPMSL